MASVSIQVTVGNLPSSFSEFSNLIQANRIIQKIEEKLNEVIEQITEILQIAKSLFSSTSCRDVDKIAKELGQLKQMSSEFQLDVAGMVAKTLRDLFSMGPSALAALAGQKQFQEAIQNLAMETYHLSAVNRTLTQQILRLLNDQDPETQKDPLGQLEKIFQQIVQSLDEVIVQIQRLNSSLASSQSS